MFVFLCLHLLCIGIPPQGKRYRVRKGQVAVVTCPLDTLYGVSLKMTPAMAAGLTDHPWTLDELVSGVFRK